MNKFFINYASNGFYHSQQYAIDQAKKFNFNTIAYNETNIDENFKNKNKEILSNKRGAGYWLWKPYIISKTLRTLDNGDYLVYMDSGACIVKDVDNILRMVDHKGILTFSMKQKISKWTKGDCFYILNKTNKNNFKDNDQIQATYIFIKKCNHSVDFIDKWLEYCTNKNLLTDIDNKHMNNFEDFIDHRHDQAILSLMVYNENIMYIPQIDQYSKEHGYGDDWVLVNRHGNRS